MHNAIKKAFVGKSGNLVEEGDPEGFVLFACVGKEVSADAVAKFPNAHEFFTGLNSPKATKEEPKQEEPREDKRKQR